MRRRFHINLPVFAYALLVGLIAVAAMNTQRNLLFWVFGVLLAGLLVSGLVSDLMMRGVRVRRVDPQHGAVGEPMVVRYAVTNTNRFMPVFNLHVAERPVRAARGWQHFMRGGGAWIMHVGPGETVHGEAVFWPAQRGEAQFSELHCWSTFPFGLVRKSVFRHQPLHTLIFPLLHRLRPDVLRAISPAGPMGARISTRPGPGDDYFGLREYRPGDSLRHVSWKRSALLDELIIIERSMPSPPRLRIVLDLTTPTADLAAQSGGCRDEARRLEEDAISLAASIIRAAEHAGYEVGLLVPGTLTPTIPIRRSRWHLDKMMAALAAIDLDAPRDGPTLRSVAESERAGLVIVHPTRPQPLATREDALALSATQLRTLTAASDGDSAGGGATKRVAAAPRPMGAVA